MENNNTLTQTRQSRLKTSQQKGGVTQPHEDTVKTAPPKRKWRKRSLRYLLFGTTFLIVMGFLFNWIWMSSDGVIRYLLFGTSSLIITFFLLDRIWMMTGSNQWELARDKDGVKIYTAKAPGSRLIKVKAIGRIQSKLAGIAKLIVEPGNGDDLGYYDDRIIERIGSLPGHYYCTWRYDYPFPFKTREFVQLTTFDQDPQSKEIFIEIIATPNKIPPDESCVRVTQMHNTWRFTPLKNGEVDVEFLMDANPLQSMPYLLTNLSLPAAIHGVLNMIQEILNKGKYQNAKIDYVQELVEK